MQDLSKLPNIGKILAEKLSQAGITSFEELASIGSIEALGRIRSSIDPQACYNILYAVEGAIRGVRWHAIPREERQELRNTFDKIYGNCN
jgi:DNA transformation protein